MCLSMVYILNCNSLLILNKPVIAEEIGSSLFVLDQHFGGTYRIPDSSSADEQKQVQYSQSSPLLLAAWLTYPGI